MTPVLKTILSWRRAPLGRYWNFYHAILYHFLLDSHCQGSNTLKIESTSFSETQVNFQPTTRHRIPGDLYVHRYRSDNLRHNYQIFMKCGFRSFLLKFVEQAWASLKISSMAVILLVITKLNSVALVRTRTIPTERPPPVGEVSANFCG